MKNLKLSIFILIAGFFCSEISFAQSLQEAKDYYRRHGCVLIDGRYKCPSTPPKVNSDYSTEVNAPLPTLEKIEFIPLEILSDDSVKAINSRIAELERKFLLRDMNAVINVLYSVIESKNYKIFNYVASKKLQDKISSPELLSYYSELIGFSKENKLDSFEDAGLQASYIGGIISDQKNPVGKIKIAIVNSEIKMRLNGLVTIECIPEDDFLRMSFRCEVQDIQL